MKSWSLRLAIAAALLVVAAFLAVVLSPGSALPPLPSPNGYDDFVAAAAAVPETNEYSDYRQWAVPELEARVVSSSNALALVKSGLPKACRVPPFPSAEESAAEASISRLASFKRLAYALAARAQLALVEGRTNDAIEASLDAVQVAHGIARGGVMIEALVSMACENIALQPLSGRTMDALDAATARSAARRLALLDSSAPTLVETLAGEHAFSRRHGFYGSIMAAADRFGFGPLAASRKSFESKWATQLTRRHEVILHLARRAFELEQGHAPKSDDELVPGILPVLPAATVEDAAK